MGVRRMNDAAARLRALGAEPPITSQQLRARVREVAQVLAVTEERARRLLASVVVAQMLPGNAVVKGGIGLKFRLGESGSRATRDLDVAARRRDEMLADLEDRLDRGWGTVPPTRRALKNDPAAAPRVAFTGTLTPLRQASPEDVPGAYVMQPYRVSLAFLGVGWVSVKLEVGVDEFDGGDLAPPVAVLAEEVKAAGEALGVGEIVPVVVASVEQQWAQKVHALTDPGERRGHDLVDLQLLWPSAEGRPDLEVLRDLCRRTFAWRGRHTWPPEVALSADLAGAYAAALDETMSAGPAPTTLAPDLASAGRWLRDRIAEVESATR